MLESYLVAHTPGHVDCPACQRALVVEDSELLPALTFRDAFKIWIDRRVIDQPVVAFTTKKVQFVSKRTEKDSRQYARAAGKFFDKLRLEDIHAGHFREYQKARAVNQLTVEIAGALQRVQPWKAVAGANLIRKECQVVIRVMKAAGAWAAHHEQALELVDVAESDVQRALTPVEQHKFLVTAASRPEWRMVYCWTIVALQTTAATNEMRSLRLGDVFLDQGTLQIRAEGAKNRFRIRTIPLQTPEVVWALGELIERAQRLGARGPQSYLFPLHVTADRYDATQPMTVSGIRKKWEAARSAAGLEWLRVYDLRHTSITRMAEAGVPIQVIMSFAGHISPRMQQHYTAISLQAKRRWAAAAWAGAEMPFAPGAGFAAPAAEIEMPEHARLARRA